MRILIVGLGSIARKHIAAIRKIEDNAEIWALRSSINASIEEGIKNVFDYNEIDFGQLDFVIISNPTSEHFKTIEHLLEYKIPLFIEKPVFSEVNSQTDYLLKEVLDKKITTYVACNLRFLDSIQQLNSLIKDKRINEVNVYCGSYLPDWRPNVDFRTVYSANKEMGGGVHIDLIHELDYTYWLFGAPHSVKSHFSNTSSLNISAFDYANYLWIYPTFAINIILNYYRKDRKRTLEVVTNKSTIVVDVLKNTIHDNGELVYYSEQKIMDTYYSQMKFFIQSILKNDVQFNTIEESYNILKLCMQD